jgi:hypothetical protein
MKSGDDNEFIHCFLYSLHFGYSKFGVVNPMRQKIQNFDAFGVVPKIQNFDAFDVVSKIQNFDAFGVVPKIQNFDAFGVVPISFEKYQISVYKRATASYLITPSTNSINSTTTTTASHHRQPEQTNDNNGPHPPSTKTTNPKQCSTTAR